MDYFKSINVGALWLSPIFRSPQDDFGYDISNYREIDPLFGTMSDFDHLRDVLHDNGEHPNRSFMCIRICRRANEWNWNALIGTGIKLILDFVPNHTSDEHPWFKKSVQRIEPYTNYYIWKDGIYDNESGLQPPSNWVNATNDWPKSNGERQSLDCLLIVSNCFFFFTKNNSLYSWAFSTADPRGNGTKNVSSTTITRSK